MKITAYMNLQPSHIHLDLATGTVKLDGSARSWQMDVYPSVQAAAEALHEGYSSYAVTAELPDGSVFEIRGERDQTEGKLGGYIAGVFDNFPAAYAAAAGLGVMGRRGEVLVRTAPVNVFSTVEDWKARFDLDAARAAKPADSTTLLRGIVELAADDAQALGAADPEYAVWLKLNEKFAPTVGATA
jgi:hypothetical protein